MPRDALDMCSQKFVTAQTMSAPLKALSTAERSAMFAATISTPFELSSLAAGLLTSRPMPRTRYGLLDSPSAVMTEPPCTVSEDRPSGRAWFPVAPTTATSGASEEVIVIVLRSEDARREWTVSDSEEGHESDAEHASGRTWIERDEKSAD